MTRSYYGREVVRLIRMVLIILISSLSGGLLGMVYAAPAIPEEARFWMGMAVGAIFGIVVAVLKTGSRTVQ